ncbi:MAG TPA: aspartate--tRNA ligase, partial [Planctomycetota bacterium]|nr:aspartate--tRNA ligase [Planctomycetota bacterium]
MPPETPRIPSFPRRTHTCGGLNLADAGRDATLNGWVASIRDHGGLRFLDLRDRYGTTQVVLDAALVPLSDSLVQQAPASTALRPEFVIAVEGTVRPRPEGMRNTKLPTGEIEVAARQVVILNESKVPPFDVSGTGAEPGEEVRLRYRYLDLRRAFMQRNLLTRAAIVRTMRDFLDSEGFLDLETPLLTKSTPEGARDFLVPARNHPGRFFALPQSPQLFKQLFMISGYDRYYQVVRCLRDEDLRADRQPEFTQVDIEASFIDEVFVQSLIEGLFAEVFPVAGIEVATPFPRITWQEAMDRFGIDRPDTRFGMEIVDLAGVAGETEFAPFRTALAEEGLVRGIVVPGGSGLSRKRIDELTEVAKQFGAGGLIWMKFEASGATSSIKKFLDESGHDRFRQALGAAEGDLALIVAGKKTVVWDALGNLRLRVARDEKMIPENRWDFLWVVDFPLLEWDSDGDRWAARHHPFTSPRI